MNLKITSMLLLAGIFMLGGLSGAFLYATGEAVVTDTWMQMISHTEYRYGEQGQIIARLVDYQGAPVVVNNCTATILYPDKSFFVQDDLMQESGNISGDHYYNFTTPAGPEGVYEYQATCYYDVGAQTRNKSVTNSFHLSGAFNSVLSNLSSVNSQLSELDIDLQSINMTLYDAIVASNASLAAEVSNLSEQLNVNTSTIIGAIISLEPEVYYSDGFEDGEWNDTWSLTYGSGSGINIDNGFGYDLGGYATNIFGIGPIGAEFNGAGIRLDDQYLPPVSERMAGTTYEFYYYVNDSYADVCESGSSPGGDNAYFTLNYSYSVYLVSGCSAAEDKVTFYVEDNEGDTAVQLELVERGWHLVQWYWYGDDGSTSNWELYHDGVLLGLRTNSSIRVDDFVFEGSGTVNGSRLDNVNIYKGLPVERNQRDHMIYSAVKDLNGELSDIDANFTIAFSYLDTINSTVANINTTTTNIYQYMTGTLTTNIDQILTDLGVINATVNRIETNTVDINDTVNQILTNQQNEVYMTTFSG